MNFTKEVINWYSVNKRELPWRQTNNPYFIWLSEIILQQTQVKQGLPYYERFVKNFPTVFDLANATEESVLKLWQGLGYYSRARNLHTTAKYIAQDLEGRFPAEYNELIKLKGVGDYTASAIASFAFNEVAAVVDGNVYRVLSRFYGIKTPINSTTGIKEYKTLASSLISHDEPGIYNQAIMEFGAMQCKPKNPYCLHCPLQVKCVAFQTNQIDILPIKIKKTKVSKKYFNYLVCVDKNNSTVFEKRQGKGIWQNLYQFPLFESSQSLTAEEFKLTNFEEVLLDGLDYKYTLYNDVDIVHKLSHQHLYTKFWIVELDAVLNNGISISSIASYPAPVLISNFIEDFDFNIV